jgi:hypothetical protein
VVQICWFLMIKFPCMKTLVSKKWFPIPKEVVEEQRRWLRGSGAMPRGGSATPKLAASVSCSAL